MFNLSSSLIILAILFATIFAAPLNINMGAYSPAMVVGDGAFSFSNSDTATKLINSLEGAAVDGSDANGANANGAADGANNPVQAGVVPAAAPSGLEGIGRNVVPVDENN
ncbi:putative effector protein [Golovinomyces cichoracearum]|uniref:Putative effector protein n=1 Tax=Golovinomyces cichoracearum TaxID=62708 RepID=A0A420J4V0_9PEZI|nr:putative effector protein [Golovinomyces cichoracearum]